MHCRKRPNKYLRAYWSLLLFDIPRHKCSGIYWNFISLLQYEPCSNIIISVTDVVWLWHHHYYECDLILPPDSCSWRRGWVGVDITPRSSLTPSSPSTSSVVLVTPSSVSSLSSSATLRRDWENCAVSWPTPIYDSLSCSMIRRIM